MSSISYDVVKKFEKAIAEYAGSKYAVAVESCTSALFLACKYCLVRDVTIPRRTYPGVACSIIHAGGKPNFKDEQWDGVYELKPYRIYDSALKFKRGMYIKDSFYCLSFHAKKLLPIGRGGMILTDDPIACDWFKRARFDGRSEVPLYQDKITMVGWNMYMTPEQAARGLMLFDMIKDKNLINIAWETQGYPDLSKVRAYK